MLLFVKVEIYMVQLQILFLMVKLLLLTQVVLLARTTLLPHCQEEHMVLVDPTLIILPGTCFRKMI